MDIKRSNENISLKVLSENGMLLEEESVSYVELNALDGKVGILKGHSPMAVALREGNIKYRKNGEESSFTVKGGIAKIENDNITVLV